MVKIKKILLFFTLFLVCFTLFTSKNTITYAVNPISNSDGTYNVKVNNSLTMGANAVGKDGIVEKSGEKFYTSISFDTSSLSNINLNINNKKVGVMASVSGKWTTYTYTLNATILSKALPFSARVNAMNKDINFNLTINLGDAFKVTDTIADRGERPAEFVPVISTEAGKSYQAEYGSVFIIPNAVAKIGEDNCVVNVNAYYENGDKKQLISLTDNKLKLDKIGIYHIVYKAESYLYKTSLGNNSFSEYEIMVISKSNVTKLAKYNAAETTLPTGVTVQASLIYNDSDIYEKATEQMKKISDHFEVMSVKLYSGNGEEINLTDDITLYLYANTSFDRMKTVVYYMDGDGNIAKLNTDPYGSYVKVNTKNLGIFIVCVPGVAFVMPMWGYIVICVVSVVVVAIIITVTVIVIKRKKKLAKQTE